MSVMSVLITKICFKKWSNFQVLCRKMKFTWLITSSTWIPKYSFFFQGGPNFGGGTVEIFREMDNNGDIYCYANQFSFLGSSKSRQGFLRKIEYWHLPPGIKILVVPQFSYMSDQILGKKMKNSIFRPNLTFFMAFLSQNIRTYSKILHMTKRVMLWTRNS